MSDKKIAENSKGEINKELPVSERELTSKEKTAAKLKAMEEEFGSLRGNWDPWDEDENTGQSSMVTMILPGDP